MNNLNFKLEYDPINFYKVQFNLILNSTEQGIIFGDSLITTLAYFKLYGIIEGRNKLMEDKIFLSRNTINNRIDEWRELGLIVGKRKDVKLNPELNNVISNTNVNLNIELWLKQKEESLV
jgi:hypothetical protein